MLLGWCGREVGEARSSDESWYDNVYFLATDPQALIGAARAKVKVWMVSQSGARGITIRPGFY